MNENSDPKPIVAQRHKDWFCRWLRVEEAVERATNGTWSVLIKNNIFGKMIEGVVENDIAWNRDDLQAQYRNFLGWLNDGDPQIQIDGTFVINIGTEIDPKLAVPRFSDEENKYINVPYTGDAYKREL